MSSRAASTLISRIKSMPTLPTVALRVMKVTADPGSSANDLMKIISPDPSLTTKILKIANSPFYGLTREISSLQHALAILGFKEIRNLVISTVAFESFKNFKQDNTFNISKFWEHSFTCGLAAKIIATHLKNASNELFVAGLIHDIGKLAMYISFPFEYLRLMKMINPLKIKYTVFEAEKNTFGITHDEAGKKLLEKWMFPKSIINAVGFHHHPQEAEVSDSFAFIIYAADILTHVCEMQDEEDDNSFAPELFYRDIAKLAHSFEINWSVSDLVRFQNTLTETIKQESDTIKLFFN